jgi:hypothetical protein
MKVIRIATAIVACLTFISSCTMPGELPPVSSIRQRTVAEGSLANPALTNDASLAIRKITGGNKRVTKFVLQEPVGLPGRKAWREMWIYDIDGAHKPFIMTFKEDGKGSADFEIQKR